MSDNLIYNRPSPGVLPLAAHDNSAGTLSPAYHDLFALVMQAPAAMCLLLGPEHRFAVTNPAYCVLVGKPAADLLGKAVRAAFPELEGQPFFGLLDQVYLTREPFVGNEIVIRWNRDATGQPAASWLNFVYQPILAADGQVAGIFVHAVDVTEQVRARQMVEARNAEIARLNAELEAQVAELHRSQQLIQAILDSTSAAIFVKDTAGRYLLPNRRTCMNAGCDALIGHTDDEFFPQPYVQQWQKTDQQVIATGRAVEHEEVYCDADGIHTYLSLKFPIMDATGQIYALGCVSTDITERKRMEEALRVSKERFHLVLQNADIAVFTHDRDLRYTWVCNLAEGYTHAMLLGKTDADCFPPVETTRLMAVKRQVLETGVGTRTEITVPMASGARTYDLRIEPLHDPTGELTGITCAAVDITERKRAEQERTDLLAREQTARVAAEQAAARTARLQAVTAALSQALTPHQVVDVMLEQGLDALHAQAGSVVQVTTDGTALELTQARGYPPKLLTRWQRIPLTLATPLTDATRTGTAIWVESPAHLTAQYPALPTTGSSNAWVAIPLLTHTGLIGAMGLSFAEARTFAPEERAFMLTLVQQCAQALERARLYAESRRLEAQAHQRVTRMQVLADISQAFAVAGLDPQGVLAAVTRRAAEVLDDGCIVRLLSDDGQWLTLAALHHPDPDVKTRLQAVHNRSIPVAGSPIEQAVQTGEPLLIPRVAPDDLPFVVTPKDQVYRDSLVEHSLLLVPLRVRGQVIGTLGLVRDTTEDAYTPDDQWFAQSLADRAALALDAARLYAAEQQARAAAEAAVQTRNKVFSLVSHDLLNPLSAVLGYTQLLQRQVRQPGN